MKMMSLLLLQMSDVVTALKLTSDPAGSNPAQSSPLDADQSAVDAESGKTCIFSSAAARLLEILSNDSSFGAYRAVE